MTPWTVSDCMHAPTFVCGCWCLSACLSVCSHVYVCVNVCIFVYPSVIRCLTLIAWESDENYLKRWLFEHNFHEHWVIFKSEFDLIRTWRDLEENLMRFRRKKIIWEELYEIWKGIWWDCEIETRKENFMRIGFSLSR